MNELNNKLIKDNNLPDAEEICWYFGQYYENLSDTMINGLINRYIDINYK